MMSFDVTNTRQLAHLTCITIAYKDCLTPFFILKPRMPYRMSLSVIVILPLWIVRATVSALQAVRDFLFCFLGEYASIPGRLFAGALLGHMTEKIPLPLWQWYSFIPTSSFLPLMPFGNSILVEQGRDA